VTKRLKLNSLTICGKNNNSCLPPYQFTYNSEPLPPKTSFSVDFWGYANGNANGGVLGETFIPRYFHTTDDPVAMFPYIGGQIYECFVTCDDIIAGTNNALAGIFFDGTDRLASETIAQSAALTKIDFPTGASTQLQYELHEFSNADHIYEGLETLESFQELATISESNWSSAPPYLTSTFEVGGVVPGGSSIYVNASWKYQGSQCSQQSALMITLEGVTDPNFSESFTVIGQATSVDCPSPNDYCGSYQEVEMPSHDIIGGPAFTVPAGEYKATITPMICCLDHPTVSGECNDGFEIDVSFWGFPPPAQQPEIERKGAGLRTKSVISDDGNGNVHTTYYDYVLGNGEPSGILHAVPVFKDYIGGGGFAGPPILEVPAIGDPIIEVENGGINLMNRYIRIHSNSQVPLTNAFAPGVVGYSRVVKSYGEQAANGKEIKEFFNLYSTPQDQDREKGLNAERLGVPLFYNMKNGKLLKNKVYDNAHQLIKETEYAYSTDWHEFDWIWSCKVKPIAENNSVGDCTGGVLQFIYYALIPQRHLLDSIIEKSWGTNGEGPLTLKTAFQYDDQYFVLKQKTQIGEISSLTTHFKYPQDVQQSSDPCFDPAIMNEMVNRNMTGIPVEITTTGDLLSGSRACYTLHNGMILPEKTYKLEGSDGWDLQQTAIYQDGDIHPDQIQKHHYPYAESYTWQNDQLKSKSYHTWTESWDYFSDTRLLQSSTAVDGTQSFFNYDNLHRITEVVAKGKASATQNLKSTTIYAYQYGLATGGENKITSTTTFGDGASSQIVEQTFDGFGRPLLSTGIGYSPFLGDAILSQVTYDEMGRKITEKVLGSPPESFSYEASPLQRMLSIDHVDGSATTLHQTTNEGSVGNFPAHSLLVEETTDENGVTSYGYSDPVLNRTVMVINGGIAGTSYEYDDYGNLETVTTPNGNAYAYQYDGHSRMTQKSIPGGGTYVYGYDDRDRMISENLPGGEILTHAYDEFDRLKTTHNSNGDLLIEYTYDENSSDPNVASKGKLTKSEVRVLGNNEFITTSHSYDKFGREKNTYLDYPEMGWTEAYINTLDHADNLTHIDRTHGYNGATQDIKTTYVLDHSFRLEDVYLKLGTAEESLISASRYNAEDLLVQKKLGYKGRPLQTIDYGYTDRYWLKRINDIEDIKGIAIQSCIPENTDDCSSYCDYEVTLPGGVRFIIYGVYGEGGSLLSLDNYPYNNLSVFEADLEAWLTTNNYPFDNVVVSISETTGEVTIKILQSGLRFNFISAFVDGKDFLEYFTRSNCTILTDTSHPDPSDNGGGETDDDLCALCETYGYLCDECPYWELQDSCTTCTELGLMDCNKCEYEEDPCVRCQNMEIPDCKECALTLRYIQPRTIQVEYSLGGLGDSTKASLIRITEEALYAGNNGAVPQIRAHARMAVVGTAHEVQTDTLNYLMEIDMTDQFIYSANGDSVLTVLSSRVSDELALAGLAQSAKAPQFIQEVVSMAGNFWNNNTTLETDDFEQGPSGGYEGYFENPDLFALHLNYGEGNDVVSSPGQLNGNISGMTWGVQGHQPITYGFWYDGLNRLTKAESGYKDQNQLWLPTNYWGTLYTYDNEGNILSLKRRGILEECPDPHPQGLPAFVFDQIDNLGYTYSNNRLQAVNENAGELKGYKGTGGTYQYDGGATDGPGNITYDGNKDISIEYNYLNLPEKITFNSQGSIIEWTYDATGRKIKKVVSGSSGSYSQLYLEGVEYKDNQLISIQHEEGRAVPNAEGTGFRQEFVLRDHLGNARVHFSDLNGDGALQPFACNPAVPCVPLGNGGGYTEMLQVQHYYPFGMEFDGPWEMPLDPDEINHYTYNGKELNRDFGLGWLDYGARYMDPSIGRFISVDPMADAAPAWTPYRYAFNNPLKYIDPDGMYEWRVNSKTGEYERFGDKGGDTEQHIYWDDDKESSATLKGETIYVGEAALDRFSDGEFGYAISTTDLWSNVPDEYIGEYTVFDLKEREEARQAGGVKFESIQKQEAAGLARRDQIWNNKDYGAYLDNKYGSRAGLIMAYDTGLLGSMMPGGFNQAARAGHNALRGGASKARGFNPQFNSVAPQAKMSWNQFQKATKGQFKGPNSRRDAAAAYKKYKASFN
jgi:RHS repeat-associated protein